jgi:hypothetical protein
MKLESISNEKLTHVTGGRERMTGDVDGKPMTPNRRGREYSAPQPHYEWHASPSQKQERYIRSQQW